MTIVTTTVAFLLFDLIMAQHFEIQIKHGFTWIPIIHFSIDATRACTSPLQEAASRVRKIHGVSGDYKMYQKTCPIKYVLTMEDGLKKKEGTEIETMRFYVSKQNAKSTIDKRKSVEDAYFLVSFGQPVFVKRKRLFQRKRLVKRKRVVKCKRVEEESTQESGEEERIEELWALESLMYYSMGDLLLFISALREAEKGMHGCNNFCYTKLFEAVHRIWCPMALTAPPITATHLSGLLWERWLTNEQEKEFVKNVTQKLRKAQSALRVAHTRFMSQFKEKFPLLSGE